MRYAKWIVAVMLVALSSLAIGQRLDSKTIVTQVPFEFMVANKTMPAGECVVQAFTMDGNTLLIRNAAAKVGVLATSSQSESKLDASHYALVFEHYGDRYFLTGIKVEHSKTTYHLPVSKVQAELRAQSAAMTEEIVLASKK